MSISRLAWMLSVLLLLAACEQPLPDPPPVRPHEAAAPTVNRYKAVLVSGFADYPVWDNAVEAMAARLRAGGSVAPDIQRLSATRKLIARGDARLATRDNVLAAVGSMRAGPGEGCFVFATSNGREGGGVRLFTNEVLFPADLDRALERGCAGAPTVVIMSSCYSGVYTRPPMNRANRIVLTASRDDRNSFGCSPGRTYTNYDTCLLRGLDAGGSWSKAYVTIQHCVVASELPFLLTASEPQAWIGPEVADLPLPVAMRDDTRAEAR